MLTTRFVPGVPVWLDLGVTDSAAAAAFYGSVLGWEFASAGPGSGGYGMLTLGGRTVAALGPLDAGARSAWTLYFHSADTDATAKAVERAGGTVRAGPFDIPGRGRMAACTDPAGAEFAVWQPREAGGGLEAVTEPGTLCWTELYTTDSAAARSFYAEVFGWEFEDTPMEGLTYTVVRPAGGAADSHQGGIMELSPEWLAAGMRSHWHPYFEVADADVAVAAVTGHGGTVSMGPEDVPGVGRLASLTDPFGAPFAVITSAT